jgi:hypothetical protein
MSATIQLLLGQRATGAALSSPAPTPAPSPTLGVLSLSQTSFTIGTPAAGAIFGALAGSSIVGTSLPPGFTVNGAARTWTYDGTGSAGTPSLILTEADARATNSPNATVIPLSFANAASVQTITPSGSYVNDTEGSGGAAPTASASTFGSGSDAQPSLHFSVFRGEDVTQDMTILAYAGTADDGGISYVEFSLEGGTPVQVTQMIRHPNNPRMFGYPIKVNVNGRAFLYARARPVNGREVVERIAIRGCGSAIPTPVQEYWVDRTNGNDAWDGKAAAFVSGSRGPWKTVTRALNSNGIADDYDGTVASPPFRRVLTGRRVLNLVRSGAHEYDIGSNGASAFGGASVENRDKIIIRRATGNTGETWISKVNRGSLDFIYSWLEFQGVGLSVQNVYAGGIGIGGLSSSNAFSGCAFTQGSKIFHPDGAAGALSYGYPIGGVAGDPGYNPGYFSKGNYFAIAESDVDMPDPCGGLKFRRASRGRYTGFANHFTNGDQNGHCEWDVRWRQFGVGEGRQHAETELTVASASYNSGTGKTTLTLSGSPTLYGMNAGGNFSQSEVYMRALTGPKVGGGGMNDGANLSFTNEAGDAASYPINAGGSTDFDTIGWKVDILDNTAKTITVWGNASGILAGNLVRCFYLGHPDCLAIYGCDNDGTTGKQHENILLQNVMYLGHNQTTPWLCQSYAAPFAANGDAAVVITATGGGNTFSYSGVQGSAQLRPNDFIRNRATGEYRRIRSITSGDGTSSGTGTIYDTFSTTWASQASTFSRAPCRVSLVNYVSHKATVDYTPGYWNYSGGDWSVRCPTFVGRSPQNLLVLFDNDNGTFDNRSCFGLRNITISGGIIHSMLRASGTGAITGLNYDPARNHTISLGLSNSIVASADGEAGFPLRYSSYLATTAKKVNAADVLQAPWDIDGNPRTAGVSVLGAKIA